ncbi:vacuolar protein sorting-associated protein 21-like isoform X2 [Centruroides sculpturatus]|uniref:vacuolar protein sorting-associated protein 21-like isoform X2 n=1 Tax=Centruroides sculpturatus TaxID=218467 RepID=UPI000C6E59FC|nr:vacuolar protein sorting-associated protein 21-like isoform X2 [Centruroides sculpturatus]
MNEKSIEAKVVVLGLQGVGKTSIILRYVGQVFSRHVSPTIGASFFTCRMSVNDCHVTLQIWDTAGQERFRSMAPLYYRNANAAFLVFDVTNYESFTIMKTWVEELQRNVEEPVTMCILGALYFETSAITFEGIEDAFIHIAEELVNNYEKCDFVENSSFSSNLSHRSIGLHINSVCKKDNEKDEEHLFCC